MEKVKIRMPVLNDLKLTNIEILCTLVNKVYAVAESGMWKDNTQRIDANTMQQMLNNNALLLAEINNVTVGCVNINLFDINTAEFGMLVSDPEYCGIGIGRELVKSAELWAIDNKRAIMQLELLTPKNWIHPSKEFLKKWYTRIGYRIQSTEPFEKLYPDKINNLITPCDFTVYHKKLL